MFAIALDHITGSNNTVATFSDNRYPVCGSYLTSGTAQKRSRPEAIQADKRASVDSLTFGQLDTQGEYNARL